MKGWFYMEKQILKVGGMSCGHCKKAVENAVGNLNGVQAAVVDLEQATVEVQFDANIVTLGEIKEVIDDQGYDVE